MRRREFIALLAGAATWPLTARAQQPERVRRIGVLMSFAEADPEGQARLAAFLTTFRDLGWLDGRNSRIEIRWFAGDAERLHRYTKELVAFTPDVIVAMSNPTLDVVRQQTHTIPIVFVQVSDPVGSGFAASMARPGGTMTGFANFEGSMGGKWIELLKEVAPSVSRAAVLMHETAAHVAFWRAAQSAAQSFSVRLTAVEVHDRGELEHAVTTFAGQADGGLIVLPSPINNRLRDSIVELAARYRLPAIYPFRFFAQAGGLLSYGIDQIDQWRGAARYVDRILRGEKPPDLPVQAPTKFELAINLKTAKALGLDVPPTLLARADEVIE
jgi:ABC-type uncharacterized transport system substrate-binding protein